MPSLVSSLRLQARVIHAIILREIGSRGGGEGIGTFWILLEPIIITLIVVAIHEESGIQGASTEMTVVFLLTGYVPHLLFRHAGLAGLSVLNANTTLLYHRQVHFMDLVMARLFVEICTVLIAFTAMYGGFYYFGVIGPPHYFSYIYLGWFFHIWFIVNASLFITGAGLIWPLVRRLFQPLALIMLPAYAAFFMMSSMPTNIRYYLLFLPCADAAEIMRYGYFGDSALTYFDIPYTIVACIFMSFVGLISIFHGRRHLVI